MAPLELNEDVTMEILLRIAPDEPSDLMRASVVCKLWLRVISNTAFLRRYQSFHRCALLLGFFYYDRYPGLYPSFISTMAASLPPMRRHFNGAIWVPDCRHGLVLINDCEANKFSVWDPFSNYCEVLQGPKPWYGTSTPVVLCAVPGCNHRSWCGGPFQVVFVGVDSSDYSTVRAHVYSSESRAWYAPASASMDSRDLFFNKKRAAVIGDGIYWIANHGRKILKYDLVEHRLSLIGTPYNYRDVPVLMENEDGSLGIAGMLGSRLHICSTMVSPVRFSWWVQRRVIKLEEILPVEIASDQANVVSFAEGVEVFLISTNARAFTFELKSGRVRKVGEPKDYCGVAPFIRFFTPDRGCSKWTK